MTLLKDAQAVVFDAVGTLIVPDPPAPVVYAATAARFGLHFETDAVAARFREAFRREEEVDRRSGWVTSEPRERERWRRIVRHALPGSPPECFESLFEHFARPDSWRVAADVPAVLAALARLRLGLASNYDERLVRVVVGRPELAPLRDHVVVSSVVGVRKPHRDFFRAVGEVMRCDPAHILFVGDDLENDFGGATAAGLRAVLLDPDGRHPHVAPRIASLAELLR